MTAPDLSELIAPPHTAYVLVEAQRGVLGPESALPELAAAAESSGAIANMAAAAAAARHAAVPVIHCTAANLPGGFGGNRNARLFAAVSRSARPNVAGTEAVLPLPELGPEPDDLVLPRHHGLSSLTGGPLDSLLRNEGITTLVIAGVSLNVAIPNLVFDAVNRSYQAVVVADAVAGVPADYAQAILRHTLSLVATVVTTSQLASVWAR